MAHLSIKLLGSLQIFLDREPVTNLLGNKPRALLAYLAVESDRPHSREVLADLFWPGGLTASSRASLSQALTSLRDALPQTEGQPPFLLTTRSTVQFNRASDYDLDTAILEAPADVANAATAPALQARITAYRGPFLDGFSVAGSETFEEWQLLQRETMQRLALDALSEFAALNLSQGQAEAAISAAQRQLELDPWREDAHQQLIQAYALAGRRSEALAQFERCKQVLHDALHIAPSAKTRALAEQIRNDVGSPNNLVTVPAAPAQPAALPASPPATPRPMPSLQFPIALTPFIGRAEELAQLTRLLVDAQIRLITLVGVGGIGKTRLAIEAISQPNVQGHFADGVAFVPLAAVTAPEQVVPAIANAIGATLDASDDAKHDAKGAPLDQLTQQLIHVLQHKQVLLVLDNFEQLQAHGAELVLQILGHVPAAKFLITSREALQLSGEWVFEVGGMGHDSVALFLQAARRAQATLQLSVDDLSLVEHICVLVGEMPLAVELAGSWMRTLSCQEIADEITRDIRFLESTMRDVPERHRSIRAVCDSTWKMLSKAEQAAMKALSIFPNGFTHEAARSVAGASLQMLSALVAKSLVQRVRHGRYTLHPVIHRYSQLMLSEIAAEPASQLADIRQRYIRFYQALAQQFAAQVLSTQMPTWMKLMEREKDNIQAALEWTSDELGSLVPLLLNVMEFLYHRDPYRGYQWIQLVLARLREPGATLADEWRMRLLLRATHLITDRPTNLALAREALVLAQRRNDLAGIAEAMRSIAVNTPEAEPNGVAANEVGPLFEESARLFTELDQKGELYDTLSLYAQFLRTHDQIAKAFEVAQRAVQVARAVNSPIMIAHGLSILSPIMQRQGDLAQALQVGQESIRIFGEVSSKRAALAVLSLRGQMAMWQNDDASARQHFETAKQFADELGSVAERRHILDKLHELDARQRTSTSASPVSPEPTHG